MARLERSIEVNVPVSTAYNQWTQFETFPEFMRGVNSVEQLDDRRVFWEADIGGRARRWEAEIQEQVPDSKIIWRSIGGDENAGVVTFEPADGRDSSRTRVHLEMSYHPSGFLDQVGDSLGFMSRRIDGDLRRFKQFIEARGVETGSYRSTLPNRNLPEGFTSGAPAQTRDNNG